MKWIDPLVHVVYTFSGALGDGVSMVLVMNPDHKMRSDVTCEGIPSCKGNLYWNWRPSRCPCFRYSISLGYPR
ncbi:hypothetical protein EDB84DRAFT_1521509 [Lactarius hengduanensis]|nr:hypothetical protein EDB84DRAFT_1521509 [Lactarius hengduanensis]